MFRRWIESGIRMLRLKTSAERDDSRDEAHPQREKQYDTA